MLLAAGCRVSLVVLLTTKRSGGVASCMVQISLSPVTMIFDSPLSRRTTPLSAETFRPPGTFPFGMRREGCSSSHTYTGAFSLCIACISDRRAMR